MPPQGTRNAGIDLYKILCMTVWFPAFGILYAPGKFNLCFFFLYILAAYLRKHGPGDRLGASAYGWLGGAFYLLQIGRLWKLWFRVLFDNGKTYGTNLMIPQILLCSAVIFASAILIDKIRIHAFERPLLALLKKCAARLPGASGVPGKPS